MIERQGLDIKNKKDDVKSSFSFAIIEEKLNFGGIIAVELEDKLVIGISSRSLFDLSVENKIYENEGLAAYVAYQRKHANDLVAPGAAFPLVRRLLKINELFPKEAPAVEVVIISRNSAETSLRIWNAIDHHELGITRAAFAGGESAARYLDAFSIDLFLSAEKEDVLEAIDQGHGAARIEGQIHENRGVDDDGPVRIAFDGDCVLFSDEAEKEYEKGGLAAFQAHESAKKDEILKAGPFKEFAQKLAALQKRLREIDPDHHHIYTAFVTARNAPAHERVLKTFQAWDLWLNESFFLGGLPKGPVLKAFKADIFFDDQKIHLSSAEENDVPAAQVLRGTGKK